MLTGVHLLVSWAGVVILSCGCFEFVILNGGVAVVRDRTRVESFGVVDGNAYAACNVYGLGYSIAALRAS
jgi:hypothetical protein